MEAEKPIVVLLHGILVTKRSMRSLERYVEEHTGLTAVSFTYKTRQRSLAEVAETLAREIRALQPQAKARIFAIACSLGSVVLRHIMALPDNGGISWTGCVLIAPPSRGSMVARRIAKVPIIGWIVGLVIGRAGRELGAETAEGQDWVAPPKPCGVIAGTKAITLLNPVGWISNLFRLIDSPNDGTIALKETVLPADMMTDYRTVHTGHTRIQNHPLVQQLVVNFIMHQTFSPV